MCAAYEHANSHANPYGNLHFNCGPHGDFHVHANADRNPYGYSPCNGERLAHLDPNTYPDAAAEPHCNEHTYADRDLHGDNDANTYSIGNLNPDTITDADCGDRRRCQLRRSDERR